MGIKDNFQKSLNKAIEGKDKMFYKSLLKNAKDLEEKENMKKHKGKTCEEIHPEITHEDWEKNEQKEMEEATTSASAGAFMAPMGMDPRFAGKKKKRKKKEEVGEATTAASSGQYATPRFLAKNEKNWKGASKTQWPGGKFVKVKDKCKKFPYCNQGDINALDLYENKKIVKAIDEVAKKTGKDKNYIKELVKKDLEEIIRRSIYKSPITSILGPKTKMNTPIGKIFTMGSNVGGKYE